ncbi:hypothetical protein L841_1602 [Mycobacterium sp. MAC_080597_8934]|nr:hypothetical protein L840_4115 [Mycobacterium sp. MAC_011194_8550]ETZ69032.1 hypothetical protein L841_1602 [Mycobacterium sp. MAC_080597_8934]
MLPQRLRGPQPGGHRLDCGGARHREAAHDLSGGRAGDDDFLGSARARGVGSVSLCRST